MVYEEFIISCAITREIFNIGEATYISHLSRDLFGHSAIEFVADPFVTLKDGVFYVFFEAMNLKKGRGEIAVAESRDFLHWKLTGTALSEKWHLSYPQVFWHGGACYLVPESGEQKAVSLYRAAEFPLGWEKVADLVEGREYLDSSLFFDGEWTMISYPKRSDEVCVFRSPALEHGWSQVARWSKGDSADVLRPAGRIFNVAGRWYRPVQRSAEFYGQDLWLKRLELTGPDVASEQLALGVRQPLLGPAGTGWNSACMHHLDFVRHGGDCYVVTDGASLVLDLSPVRLLYRLRYQVRKRAAPLLGKARRLVLPRTPGRSRA
ncbi:hypothetical protein DEIPH_ctg026orf0025 [Deinococcus phoenicis]|uniref:Glucosamine inositolphosphorylceramide transferase 1 N-terminal domain-containing protein n=1 Tax=Deinococcus phoenicis TaxID=1476583 RepID=A0A016QPZ5_9DEIO|nr:hypothetical protein DEIPH_ctg026orf0025 [Deinococcus phoenicis]